MLLVAGAIIEMALASAAGLRGHAYITY